MNSDFQMKKLQTCSPTPGFGGVLSEARRKEGRDGRVGVQRRKWLSVLRWIGGAERQAEGRGDRAELETKGKGQRKGVGFASRRKEQMGMPRGVSRGRRKELEPEMGMVPSW